VYEPNTKSKTLPPSPLKKLLEQPKDDSLACPRRGDLQEQSWRTFFSLPEREREHFRCGEFVI
jgi:hypothetical protein